MFELVCMLKEGQFPPHLDTATFDTTTHPPPLTAPVVCVS